MKDIKKYTDIIRYGKASTNGVINEGDYIAITEKIDGANASFRLDETNPLGVSCYSRNTPLTEDNRLRGFYDWVIKNIVPIKDKLNPNYVYFGEWNVSHKVQYKPETQHEFYLFSVWNEGEEIHKYEDDAIVKSEAVRLGIKTVPYFYEGEYVSFEHMMSFVGKSDLTVDPNTGEGIVVKNVNYFDNYGRQCFVKLVSEKFAEVQKQKLPKNPNINNEFVSLVKSVLTTARVEKLLHKLVDEGILKEDYAIKDMGLILKNLGGRVFEDIMKEESDLFINYEEDKIKRIIGKNLPNTIKGILRDQGRF